MATNDKNVKPGDTVKFVDWARVTVNGAHVGVVDKGDCVRVVSASSRVLENRATVWDMQIARLDGVPIAQSSSLQPATVTCVQDRAFVKVDEK